MAYDYDLLILGAGSAGLAAAKQAVRYTTKVALIEQEEIGGVCVNRGCIAKKLMVYAADFAHAFADAEGYGWSIASASFNWQQFIKQRDQEIQRIRQVQQQSLLKSGIDYIHGHAIFVDPHTVQINDRKVTADRILIAVGGIPAKLDIPGIDYAITSREMFQLQQIPERLAVIGGGYIGVEFASLFQALGSKVTLMNHEACILTGFDQDLQATVHQGLNQRGIQIFCNTTAKSIQSVTVNGKNSLQLTLSGDCNELLTADTVLCATGRSPNLQPLQLENAGIEQQGKAISVDGNSRTSQPHIYAVGDCTNRLPLTPVARAEGQIAVDAMFGRPTDQLNYGLVPSAVFSRPEAAAVGLTEAQAREQYGDKIEIRQAEFYPLFDRLSGNHLPTLSKQIFDTETKQLIGLHLVVDHAAEIVQGMSLAMQQGITATELDQMVGIHPTSAEELFG
jgi:glutathione reductase (NADPH)